MLASSVLATLPGTEVPGLTVRSLFETAGAGGDPQHLQRVRRRIDADAEFAAGDDSGEIVEVPIDETGSATVEVEGVLEIEKFDFAWCFLDSEAANAAAQIVIGKGEQAKVEILSCGPRPLNWAD